MKFTHDAVGLIFDKLRVSSDHIHFRCADSVRMKEKVRLAVDTGDYSDVAFNLVRTTELQDLDNGEQYGRYCPIEVVMENTPYFAVEVRSKVLQWLAEDETEQSEADPQTTPESAPGRLLRRIAGWVDEQLNKNHST